MREIILKSDEAPEPPSRYSRIVMHLSFEIGLARSEHYEADAGADQVAEDREEEIEALLVREAADQADHQPSFLGVHAAGFE